MLVGELKTIFIPSWKVTFIARHPDDPEQYMLLTEEKDLKALIAAIEKFREPKPITETQKGSA